MEFQSYFSKLSAGLAVSGLKDTVRALNERQVQRLIFCANLSPRAGWQCHDCLALYVEMGAAPQMCLRCGSSEIGSVDAKTEMIERAYRLGCTIEVRSRCPELERAGGVIALLHEREVTDLPQKRRVGDGKRSGVRAVPTNA